MYDIAFNPRGDIGYVIGLYPTTPGSWENYFQVINLNNFEVKHIE